MPDALEKQKILSSLASPLAVRDERIKPLAVPLFFIRNRMHSADTSAMSCRCNGQPPSLLTSHPPWAKPLRGDFRIASAPPYTNRRLSETESTMKPIMRTIPHPSVSSPSLYHAGTAFVNRQSIENAGNPKRFSRHFITIAPAVPAASEADGHPPAVRKIYVSAGDSFARNAISQFR